MALWRGVRVHGRVGVAVLGALGIVLMAISIFAVHGSVMEIVLSVVGVSMLAGAHLWNIRASRGIAGCSAGA